MPLVHRTLHKGTGLDRLELGNYIQALVASIVGTAFRPCEVAYSLPKEYRESIDTAISLGIAINELVAHAIKHAQPRATENVTTHA